MRECLEGEREVDAEARGEPGERGVDELECGHECHQVAHDAAHYLECRQRAHRQRVDHVRAHSIREHSADSVQNCLSAATTQVHQNQQRKVFRMFK